MNRAAVYRTIWRWHFYAGLFVIPFIILLSLSGAAYLFKPQVERWEERGFHAQAQAAFGSPALPHQQVGAALITYGGGRVVDYRLPAVAGDAAVVKLAWPSGNQREVFVAPDGMVLGHLDPANRIMAWVKRIHSEVMLGTVGNRLVELAACWAIVMVLTGLYLWWPQGKGLAGVLYPRLNGSRRIVWRDLHGVTGFWVAGLALVLLVSGLPWAGVWGSAFKDLRTEMGWVKGPAQWDIDGNQTKATPPPQDDHAHHGHGSLDLTSRVNLPAFDPRALDRMVAEAQAHKLAFPVLITPPGAPGAFGAEPQAIWTVRSDVQNRPLRQTLRYDLAGEVLLSHDNFANSHPIDKAVAYGVAWHEGQLFGVVNQVIGVVTALALVFLAVSGCVLWWRRKPEGSLGAPPQATTPTKMGGAVVILLLLAMVLPLLALSLVGLLLIEWLVLPFVPAVARWLGKARKTPA